MYEEGSVTYFYVCYGINHLLNVLTGLKGNPQALLIRAVEPLVGIEIMLVRRNMIHLVPRITAEPGSVEKAFGIEKTLNAKDLLGDEIEFIVPSPNLGIDYADDHALLPWRFYIKGNIYVNRPNFFP